MDSLSNDDSWDESNTVSTSLESLYQDTTRRYRQRRNHSQQQKHQQQQQHSNKKRKNSQFTFVIGGKPNSFTDFKRPQSFGNSIRSFFPKNILWFRLSIGIVLSIVFLFQRLGLQSDQIQQQQQELQPYHHYHHYQTSSQHFYDPRWNNPFLRNLDLVEGNDDTTKQNDPSLDLRFPSRWKQQRIIQDNSITKHQDEIIYNAIMTNPLEFIHITKTGGTAIEIAAAQQNITWGLCHFERRPKSWIYNYDKDNNNNNSKSSNSNNHHDVNACQRPNWKHLVIHDPNRNFQGELWHTPPTWMVSSNTPHRPFNPYLSYPTFTIVRNPYDRILSEYYCPYYGFHRRDNRRSKSSSSTLERQQQQSQRRDYNDDTYTRKSKSKRYAKEEEDSLDEDHHEDHVPLPRERTITERLQEVKAFRTLLANRRQQRQDQQSLHFVDNQDHHRNQSSRDDYNHMNISSSHQFHHRRLFSSSSQLDSRYDRQFQKIDKYRDSPRIKTSNPNESKKLLDDWKQQRQSERKRIDNLQFTLHHHHDRNLEDSERHMYQEAKKLNRLKYHRHQQEEDEYVHRIEMNHINSHRTTNHYPLEHRSSSHRKEDTPRTLNRWIQMTLRRYNPKTGHMLPQWHYIFDENGHALVTHILRFENLTAEFQSLMQQYHLNISLSSNRTINAGYDNFIKVDNSDFRSNDTNQVNEAKEIFQMSTKPKQPPPSKRRFTIQDLEPATLDIIHHVYHKDFELLGYPKIEL